MATPSAQSLAQEPLDLQALRFEHESLSLQATQLAGTLARRRADLALMRGEAATVALSLESAKQRLDSALRTESSIRASAPPSPLPSSGPTVGIPALSIGGPSTTDDGEAGSNEHSKSSPRSRPLSSGTASESAMRTDFLLDDGLVRALTGQLEVTRKSVRQAEHRRDAIAKDIADLKARVLEGAQRNYDEESDHEAAVRLEQKRIDNFKNTTNFRATPTSPYTAVQQTPANFTVLSSMVVDEDAHQQVKTNQLLPKLEIQIPAVTSSQPVTALVQTPREGDWEERRRSSLASMERNMLRTLEEGAKSRSSFRLDHARIWRDSTMPNALLVDDTQQSNKLGVVTERIFEGTTCFACTDSDSALIDIRLANDISEPVDISDDVDDNNDDCEPQKPFKPDGVLCANVVDKYATLCSDTHNQAQTNSQAGSTDGRIVARIVAPHVALDRVRKLASDACRRSSSARAGRSDFSISDNIDAGSVTKQLVSDISNVALSPPTLNANPSGVDGAGERRNGNGGNAIQQNNNSGATSKSKGKENGNENNGIDEGKKNGNKDGADGDDEEEDDDDDVDEPILPSPKRSDSSSVLDDCDFAELMEIGVPARFHECTLRLLYSTEVHGMSLRTLYNRCRTASPTLVAIRDTHGRAFGCYAAQAWRASATRYYGTGESFVFGLNNEKTKKNKKGNRVHVFKWSRDNSLFQFTSGSFLAIGGGAGSHFALWVDEDLLMGTTASCSTFHSPPLTHAHIGPQGHDKKGEKNSVDGKAKPEQTEQSMEFNILALEVWSFVTGRL